MDTIAFRDTLDRKALVARYRSNRERTAEIFAFVEPQAFETRPIPLRHPFVFYEGHIPAFSHFTLVERALGGAPIDPVFEKLFERGIDPEDEQAAAAHARDGWPSREAVQAFGKACDRGVIDALQHAHLEDAGNPKLVRAQAAWNILEHEPMHHETLLYIVHQLPLERQRAPRADLSGAQATPPAREVRRIPAGTATLGARRDAIPFGWDNEFEETTVDVPAFEIDAYPVTNADFLAFVEAGAPAPPFWRRRDGAWNLRTLFSELALPLAWPVYVPYSQAAAYAAWRGMRVPTEAEYHRAAFGAPDGTERSFPWGDAAPSAQHGNFGFARFDPEPVDAHPAGASAFGVHDLIGNGWEWTSTKFGPFAGFEPMASYPVYSADFFDDQHYIVKGASPVTDASLIRRSLRNWYRPDYPYIYAKFRCAASG